MVFITDKLRFSGLEGTFVEGITVPGLLVGVTLIVVREDEEVGEKRGFDNRAEFDEKSVFLFFVGVSGRGVVVVSKAACTWMYTLEKSFGFRHAAA